MLLHCTLRAVGTLHVQQCLIRVPFTFRQLIAPCLMEVLDDPSFGSFQQNGRNKHLWGVNSHLGEFLPLNGPRKKRWTNIM